MLLYTQIESPIDEILLVGDEDGLRGLYMTPHKWGPDGIDPAWRSADEPFAEAREQLGQYFAGERTKFDLKLNLVGTPFRLQVWNALLEIPFGETRSYMEIARQLGDPSAVRAVGLANGRNPISIVVPCHRVIGADGSLVGYGGGLDRKRILLDHESVVSGQRLPL